jgi:hypothetical protein
VRTFDVNGIILEENFRGYRDWADATAYYTEVDPAGIAVPSLDYESYATSGERQHLALTINNVSGSTQDVRVEFAGTGLGLWVHNTTIAQNEVEVSFRYKADPALDGCSANFHIANSPFGGFAEAVPAICDGEWHTVPGTWYMQVDASLFAGGYVEVADIPVGADGVFRFAALQLVRRSNVMRVIDSTCPIAWMRPDWGDGIRERISYPTHVHEAHDGTEHRQQLRLIPRWRIEYPTIAEDATEAGRLDAWLWTNLGKRVAVPRWMDALPFTGTASSGHELFMAGEMAHRWFQPRQRALIWESPTKYEAVIIDTLLNGATSRITTDPTEDAVDGTYRVGPTLVVPLVPARLASALPVRRPNNASGHLVLVFDLDMVQ